MLRIIKTIGEVISQNNTEKIKCVVCDISDSEKKEFEIELTLVEYELVKMLNNIQSAANLYPPIMNELYDKIQRYANKKYQQGMADSNTQENE